MTPKVKARNPFVYMLILVVILPPVLTPLLALADTTNAGPLSPNPEFCKIVDIASKEIQEIRGLTFANKVNCTVQDKNQVQEYLKHTISTKIPPGRLEQESVVYKALGIIPEDYDYVDSVISLYLSQLSGYYDPDHKKIILVSWMPPYAQIGVAWHELTHALQDQYYKLNSFIDMKMENGDLMLARSALIEGDATAAMMDALRKKSGEKPLQSLSQKDRRFLTATTTSSGATHPGVPPSLSMILIFPYSEGFSFVLSLLGEGGYKDIDHAFSRPPRSTEEILHPEKYKQEIPDFKTFLDSEVAPSSPEKDINILYRDTVGEFVIYTMLKTSGLDGGLLANASRGWGGDRLVMQRQENSPTRYVYWKTAWDSDKDASEFADAFLQSLGYRFPEASFGKRYPQWTKLGEKYNFRYIQNEAEIHLEWMLCPCELEEPRL